MGARPSAARQDAVEKRKAAKTKLTGSNHLRRFTIPALPIPGNHWIRLRVICLQPDLGRSLTPHCRIRFFSKQVGEKDPRTQGVKGPSDCFQKHSILLDPFLNTRYMSRICLRQPSNQQHHTALVTSTKLSLANGVLKATAYVSNTHPERR